MERCWSFANDALTAARRYASAYGNAEALSVDAQGAWIGVDNGNHVRFADGEARPVVLPLCGAARWLGRPVMSHSHRGSGPVVSS